MTPTIISTLIGKSTKDPYKYIKKGWQDTKPYMTGYLMSADNVHSICSGIVLDVGIDNKTKLYSVTVEYEYLTWVRYCLLQTCDVKFGEKVSIGTKLGKAYKGTMRFEYCNNNISDFPVRLDGRCLYKQDPLVILEGDLELPDKTDEVTDNG